MIGGDFTNALECLYHCANERTSRIGLNLKRTEYSIQTVQRGTLSLVGLNRWIDALGSILSLASVYKMSLVARPVGFYPFSNARRRLRFRIVRKKRKQSWSLYLRKIQKQFFINEFRISRAALDVMEDMMNHVFRMIATEAHHLVQITKRRTLTARDIETAVKLIIPGGLGTTAICHALKSIRNYEHPNLV